MTDTFEEDRSSSQAEGLAQERRPEIFIGLDIGKTSIKAAFVQGGQILKWQSVPAATAQGSDALIKQAEDLVSQFVAESSELQFAGIGIATTGVADVETGLWHGSTSVPGASKIAVGPLFEKTFRVPAYLENDVNCAALGEAKFGAMRDHPVAVLLVVASGIKFCVVRNGCPEVGQHLLAGHVAHLPLWKSNRTLFEIASGIGIAATAERCGLGNLSTREVFDLSATGNVKAVEIVDDAIQALGGLVSWIQLSLDPTIIVMGGGVIDGQRKNDILGKIKQVAQDNMQRIKMMPELNLEYWSLGPHAGIIGAAALCLSAQAQDSLRF